MDSLPFHHQPIHATGIPNAGTEAGGIATTDLKRRHAGLVMIDLCSSSSSESESETKVKRSRSDQSSYDQRRREQSPLRKRLKIESNNRNAPTSVGRIGDVGDNLSLNMMQRQVNSNVEDLASNNRDQHSEAVEVGPPIRTVAQESFLSSQASKADTHDMGFVGSASGFDDQSHRSWLEKPRGSRLPRGLGIEAPSAASTDENTQKAGHKTTDKGQLHDDGSKCVAIPSPAESDAILVQAADSPNVYRVPQNARKRATEVKLEPRAEIIQTRTGISRRKFIGPFISEDSDDDDERVDDDKLFQPREVRGKISFSSGEPLQEANSSRNIQTSGRELIDDSGATQPLGSKGRCNKRNVEGRRRKLDLELLQRRKRSEENCAEMSRRMREATLARRKEKDAGEESCSHKHDPMVNGLPSQDYRGGEWPLARSASQGYGRAAETEVAGSAAEAQKLINANSDATTKPGKEVVNSAKTQRDGGDSIAIIANSRAMEAQLDDEITSNIIHFPQGSYSTSGQAAKDDNSASKGMYALVREPLKAARNSHGGLAVLAKIAAEQHSPISNGNSRATYQRKDAKPVPRQSLWDSQQGFDDDSRHGRPIDSKLWTRDAKLPSYKRDVQNLMNTLTETARCWWLTNETMTHGMRTNMQTNLLEVLRDFTEPILRGYSLRPGRGGKRLVDIKHLMLRRVPGRRMETGVPHREPSQRDIEVTLINLIGKETLRDVKRLLHKVVEEFGIWTQDPERSRKEKKRQAKHNLESQQTGSARVTNLPLGHVEEIKLDSDDGAADLIYHETPSLSTKQKVAWAREDEKIKQLSRTIARYKEDEDAVPWSQPAEGGSPTRKSIWDDDEQSTVKSEDQESDEDQDEIAPSFGRSKEDEKEKKYTKPGMIEGAAAKMKETPTYFRETVSGKGILSEIRRRKKEVVDTPICDQDEDETAPSSGRSKEKNIEKEFTGYPVVQGGATMTTKSPTYCRKTIDGKDGLSGIRQRDEEDLDTTTYHGSLNTQIYRSTHTIQYTILVDYEDFPGFPNAESIPLGTHIDGQAAIRHMACVANDIAASMSRKHRQMRVIWDIEDFELGSQTVILNTGGQCRIRIAKLRIPLTEWPGRLERQEASTTAAARPKVLYLVREVKTTTSLVTPAVEIKPQEGDGDVSEGHLDGLALRRTRYGDRERHEANPLVERECDMYFSNRSCANNVAKTRFHAFISRHNPNTGSDDNDDDDDDEEGEIEGSDAGNDKEKDTARSSAAEHLTTYMDQIEHDQQCFEQEIGFTQSTAAEEVNNEQKKTGRRVEIKIWVEELMVDLDLTRD